jgi:hypothetical protein
MLEEWWPNTKEVKAKLKNSNKKVKAEIKCFKRKSLI